LARRSSTHLRATGRGLRLRVTPAKDARTFRLLLGVAVGAGVAFRAVQYASHRSLWLDEAMLALNILHRSAAGLTRTLDYAQAAPIGFLELEKLATHAFGESELTLRLVPFLCGLASLPLFAVLALRLLQPAPALLATLLFAFAEGPVYYASELKQYSGDLVVAIGLTLLAVVLLDDATSTRRKVGLGLLGAAAMLLSYASVFVAGGLALALAARALVRRDRDALGAAVAAVPWLLMGLFIVAFTRARTIRLEALITSEGSSSVYPHGSALGAQLKWLRELSSALLRSTGYPDAAPDRYVHWPLLVLAVVGLIGLALRRPTAAAMLVLPAAVMWIASVLHKYPVFDRTVLFLVPATALLAAEGAGTVTGFARRRAPRIVVATSVACVVLLVPLVHAAARMIDPVQHEEIKAALVHIRSHWQPGSALFVDSGARFAFRYYLDCGCLAAAEVRGRGLAWRFGQLPGGRGTGPVPLRQVDPRFVVGRLDVTRFAALKRRLDGLVGRPRVWILFTHIRGGEEMGRIAAALQELDRRGRRLDSFAAVGARAYLYDLRLRSP
jgi:hypothetical protein